MQPRCPPPPAAGCLLAGHDYTAPLLTPPPHPQQSTGNSLLLPHPLCRPCPQTSVLLQQEEYSDFNTLEARLQEVARRLVHRPGAQGPSSSQGTPGLLPNGVFDPGSSQQQQPAAQQLAVQPGTANPQMMLSAYPGALPGPGMVPTPNTAAGDGTELLCVKAEPGSSANGMVPVEGAADPSSSFQRSSLPGIVAASPALGGSNGMGTALMSNGAPVLIKQDAWSLPSPSMVPVRVLLRLCLLAKRQQP